MHTSRFTSKKSPKLHLIKQIASFLLILFLGYLTVPTVHADLPPEIYYQGIDTGVNGDDNGSDALPIGFNFDFYGNTYNQFYVASNGMITFNDYRHTVSWGNWPYYINQNIANNDIPNNYIAPFWDDITVHNDLGQRILYKTVGTAPNRMLVVQYTNVGFWNDPTPLGTFFVILYEGSNNIQFQYRYLVGANARTHGDSATIGVENAAGVKGTQFSYNTESLESEQVILFTPKGNGSYAISTDIYEPVILGLGTIQAPDIPVQTTPLNGATVSTTPPFSWGEAENATSYEIRVDDNPNMGSLEIHETNITDTSYTPLIPLPEGTYYWIVIAHNDNDQAWSQQWNFTASNNPPPPAPGVPLLVSPHQDEIEVLLTPTFAWQAASDAVEYQLIVSEQADLSAPLINQTGLLTTTYDATGLRADTLYYWSVIASNITDSTQSSVRRFTSLHINRAPTANNDSQTVAEDSGTTALNVLANDTDPDSDVLSIDSIGSTSSDGTAVINNNQIDYTPAANFNGSETFTYTVSDNQGSSATATVTVTVTAVNDAPVAHDDNYSVTEDSETVQLDVLTNDSDIDVDDILSLTSVSTPTNGGTAVLNNNKVDYTPAANFFGIETLTYTTRDGQANSTATIIIKVTSVNDLPTANDDSKSIIENSGPLQINVLGNDTDADVDDTLFIASVSAPNQGGTAVVNNNQINYTATPDFVGIETFTYTVSDGHGGSDTATVTITSTVSGSNAAPQAQDDSPQTREDTSIIIHVLANDNDPDGDSLSILDIGEAAHGTAVIQGNTIKYTPAPNYYGSDSFTYTLCDGEFTDVATVHITIVSVNDLPQAGLDTSSTTATTSITIKVLDNDLDPVEGSPLSITSVANPAHGTARISGNQIIYTPDNGFLGTETFTYTLYDGTDSVTGTIRVTVNPFQLFIPLVKN